MGWLIFLGIAILLGCLPLGVRLRYGEDGFFAAVLLGKIKIAVYPMPDWLDKRLHKPKKKSERAKPPEPRQEPPKAEQPSGGSVARFLPFIRLGLRFLGDLRRKLRVNRLELKLILAGDDPCDVAVNYGRAWAALGNLMPRLDRALVIKKRNVEVECDFLAEETKVLFAMDLTVTLGRILGLGLGYGFRAIKLYMNLKNQKAVQTNE